MSLHRRQVLAGMAGTIAMPAISRLSFASIPDRPIMPIPCVVDAAAGQIHLRMQAGKWSFDGKKTTPTWGFSQDYLGPVLRVRRGNELPIHYENTLPEAVAVHGHGLHVSGELDGGPQRTMAPGKSWSPVLPIAQEAATVWYHSHTHNKTGPQVYNGLAGMMIIDDDNSDSLPLPRRYGIDDLPFVVQDKDFHEDGTLNYNEVGLGRFYAEHQVVNGKIQPRVQVPKGLVRLRMLNGSNGRFYNFAFADKRMFHVVAGDGGFLEEPVETDMLLVNPGERYEVVVDFSDGLPVNLRSVQEKGKEHIPSFFDFTPDATTPPPGTEFTAIQGEQTICMFEVNADIPADTDARIPSRMNKIDWFDPAEVRVTRHFKMVTNGMTINGKHMDMRRIDERVVKGTVERWVLEGDLHNFHAHGCSFQVDSVNGEAPPAYMRSWKDTVITNERSSFIVRFDHLASDEFPYMFHCHLLEHEDMGMMGQFVVHS